jgi:outer membrane protein TolC
MKTNFFVTLFLLSFMLQASAQSMNFYQVLQQVVDHYPSVKTALYQLERAQQENKKIESQLGWRLTSQVGVLRDVSAFGTPVDSLNLSASLFRKLATGATVEVAAAISKNDSSNVFSPFQPNPVTLTGINLKYRLPLAKGYNNPLYSQGLEFADAGVRLAEAEQKAIYDLLAGQLIELYLAAAITQAKIKNAEQSIERSKRLKKYIYNRRNLGVAEEKDILQVEALLKNQQAERQGLLVIWQKQKISLNRLMGKKWHQEFYPAIQSVVGFPDKSESFLYAQVKQNSSSLWAIKGQLQQAESAIKIQRDAKKDSLDLLLSIGNKTSAGDTIANDISESELVGGVVLEFNRGIDKRAYDAELYQAQIDRGIALQNKQRVLEDLQYNLFSLLAEIKAGNAALNAYKLSASSEKKKLNEAERRYKKGRADTDQLIQFETQLSMAELAVNLQTIELLRRFYGLSLLRGELWENIYFADINISFKQEQ